MQKIEIKKMFGSYYQAAKDMHITPGAITQWEDSLQRRNIEMVVCAALRTGRITGDKAKELLIRG